jgi:hypothetical protein
MYPTVIREMIRHENDVTNHRIMWLLIVQGLIANAYVSAHDSSLAPVLAAMGVLVTLSAFVMLYKSYQARGYLDFLGRQAKLGLLTEEQLPLAGWPKVRVQGWRKGGWRWMWLDRPGDLLEPYLFLPALLMLVWSFELRAAFGTRIGMTSLALSAAAAVAIVLPAVCFLWLWLHGLEPIGRRR